VELIERLNTLALHIPWFIPSRRTRFRLLNRIMTEILKEKGSCKILDIGGTDSYWDLNKAFLEEHRGKLKIILVNLDEQGRQDDLYEYRRGDATNYATYQGDFDLIHSNSVIEHVGPWAAIRDMADLIRDTKKPYYLQTPNFWFPIEPHFRCVGIQWLPKPWRVSLISNFKLGSYGKATTYDQAKYAAVSNYLLTSRDMRELFPTGKHIKERFFGWTKSHIVYGRLDLKV